jgi:hypothetical protein
MLKGKIIHDGPAVPSARRDYCVKVGSVTVDITDEVRTLIALEVASVRSVYDQALTDLRAKHADTVERYNQIARIVLAGGAGMPTG